MNETRMSFHSLIDLHDKKLWIKFLGELQTLLGHKLSHLEVNDLIRNMGMEKRRK